MYLNDSYIEQINVDFPFADENRCARSRVKGRRLIENGENSPPRYSRLWVPEERRHKTSLKYGLRFRVVG